MANNSKQSIVSTRYSEALIGLVNDGKLSFDKVSKDLNLIQEVLKNSPDLNEFLTNPVVSIENKKEIIDKVFAEEVNLNVLNFLKVLIDKDRFGLIEDIINSYAAKLDNVNNLARVSVVSAVELTQENKGKLKQKLEEKMNKQVSLEWEINPDIIAGLIIKIGDTVIDTSLKHKLEDLSKTIIK